MVSQIPSLVSVEPNKVALLPSQTSWKVTFNTRMKKTGSGHLGLRFVRGVKSGSTWKVPTGLSSYHPANIYPSSVTMSDDGLSANVSYPHGDRLDDTDGTVYYFEMYGIMFEPINATTTCSRPVTLPSLDFWMFRCPLYKPANGRFVH